MFFVPVPRTLQRAIEPSLSRAFDHLLDPAFRTTADAPSVEAAPRTPALDVSESDSAYTLALDMPGVTREQVQVSVQGRRVSVESVEAAADTAKPQAAAARMLYRERRPARYSRTVSLPTAVEESASQAKFEGGVLTLTLLKKVAGGATRVSVN